MPLTPAQLSTLTTDLAANTNQVGGVAINVIAKSADNAIAVAGWYNQNVSPAFVVWKKSVSTLDVGKAVNYVAVAAMTTANLDRVKTFYTMNPSAFQPKSDVRTYWSDTFSGALGGQGQASRDALDALWRRDATNVEKLFATGTGTTVSPADLTFEGRLSDTDVRAAWGI